MKTPFGRSAAMAVLVALVCYFWLAPQGPIGPPPLAAQSDDRAVQGLRRIEREDPVIRLGPEAEYVQTTIVGQSSRAREREEKILHTLDEETEFQFFETPLSEVMDYLEARHDIEIEIDALALKNEGIASDTPVTRELRGISLRASLNLLLCQLDLTYEICQEVLVITSPDAVDQELGTRIYRSDLFSDLSEEDREALIQLVVSTVESDSWEQNGGGGKISYFAPSSALLVTQTPRTHLQVESLLSKLAELHER